MRRLGDLVQAKPLDRGGKDEDDDDGTAKDKRTRHTNAMTVSRCIAIGVK